MQGACDLDELVNIPRLLARGGLVESPAAGHAAMAHGRVFINRWNVGTIYSELPRWVLRGVTLRVGERAIEISGCGTKIKRSGQMALT